MFSIADIPFKLFEFRGFICAFILDSKEYRFTTYNNSKLVRYSVTDNFLDISIKKGDYLLNIKSQFDNGNKLKAPVKGNMNKDIYERISANIEVTLFEKKKIIFLEVSKNCGLEIV